MECIRGEGSELKDMEEERVRTDGKPLPLPSCMADGTTVIPEEPEVLYTVSLRNGEAKLLSIKKSNKREV